MVTAKSGGFRGGVEIKKKKNSPLPQTEHQLWKRWREMAWEKEMGNDGGKIVRNAIELGALGDKIGGSI